MTQGVGLDSTRASPDGRRIALSRTTASRARAVISVSSTVRAPAEISQLDDTGCTVRSAWSPDGMRIAFEVHDVAPAVGLYIVNRDGSGLRALDAVARSRRAAQRGRPTAQWIAFSDADG